MKKFLIPLIIITLAQIFISNIISIRGVKPDFVIIFLTYFAFNQGSFRGVIVGFILGITLSLFDNRPDFGLLPLTYSIVGYLFGLLKHYSGQFSSIKFNLFSYLIIFISFFVYSYFLFESIFYNDFPLFILYWLKNMSYTVMLIVISRIILPIRR